MIYSANTSIPLSVDAELRKLASASELTRGGYARDAIIDQEHLQREGKA